MLPSHPRYHGRSKTKTTFRHTIHVNNVSFPFNIGISMKSNISSRISQTKGDLTMQTSQNVFGSDPMCMGRLGHELTHAHIMLWGLASNHTIPSSTYKHVPFDPLLKIPMIVQHTLLLVTFHGGMLSSCPSNVGSILDLQQEKLSNKWLYIEP